MGFNDGISNPNRLLNDVVWTTKEDEGEKFKDGTYMVFCQRSNMILRSGGTLTSEEQERWVGRSKGTGLLLGTSQKMKMITHVRSTIGRSGYSRASIDKAEEINKRTKRSKQETF